MPVMSRFEAAFCRGAPWRTLARHVVLPWALQGRRPSGHVLEIGAGSGAMAAELLAMLPDITMTVTDVDPAMVDAAAARLGPFRERATVEVATRHRCRSRTPRSMRRSAGSFCTTPSSGRWRWPRRCESSVPAVRSSATTCSRPPRCGFCTRPNEHDSG